MPFAVVWPTSVEQDLARLWKATGDRERVSHAIREIGRVLASRPEDSREVSEGLRRLVVPPIQVLFHISETDRIVQIDAVKLAPDIR